jgi:hypothetical protein
VDIEGAEISALPEWISSGIIDDVDQIGLEIHTNFDQKQAAQKLASLLVHILAISRGRCYDHNMYSANLDNFRRKIGVFLKNQCYDQFFQNLALF